MATHPLHDFQPRLDELVTRVHAETRVPGIGIGVATSTRRFYACAGTSSVGTAQALTNESRFQLGCAGKLLVAIATHELERHGVLSSAGTLGEYLPELRGSLHGDAVRVSHLLSHTSGYRGTNVLDPRTRALSWPGLVAYLRGAERSFPPGSVFSYEHTEAVLLGEILRRVSGKNADALIEELILDPLGISAPTEPAALGRLHAAGRHRFDQTRDAFVALANQAIPTFWQAAFSERTVSLVDLLTLGDAVLGRADTRGEPVISESTRRQLRRTVVRLPCAVGGPLCELLPVAFGLGAAVLRDGSHGNTGVSGGQCLGLRFDERTGICVAVALNAMVPYLRDFLLTAICSELSGRARDDTPEPLPFDLMDLEGLYIGPGDGTVHVRFEQGRLVCAIGHERTRATLRVELALDDDSRPVLRSPLPHLSLAFFREPSGEVGLMLGLGAYRRGSTNRPFHR